MDVIPLLLNKVVCEFTDLGFVDTHDLGFLACAERETGDQVHEEKNDAGHAEGVTETSDAIAQLVRELDVVLVEPSAGNDSDTVKCRNVICCEKTAKQLARETKRIIREKIADHSANTVDSEDIEGIIDADEELEFGGIIARECTDDTKDDSRPGRDVTGGGGNGNETCNGARAPTDSTPFAFKTVIDQNPGKSTDRCSKIGDDASHRGAKVTSESGTTVEAEPSEPEEDCSENDVSHVVGSVVELVSSVSTAFPKHDRIGECSRAR